MSEAHVSRSQIDKLGDRLKRGLEPSEADLELLIKFELSLGPVLSEALNEVRDAFTRAFPDAPYERTMRVKQLKSVVAKLQRMSTRLSSIQDLAGFRVVVPSIQDQETLISKLHLDDTWAVIDRRRQPSYGYRALHFIHRDGYRSIEVQIRSDLQHRWAELSEAVDRLHPGVKYGEGPEYIVEALQFWSEEVENVEEAELEAGPDQEQRLLTRRNVLFQTMDDALEAVRGGAI